MCHLGAFLAILRHCSSLFSTGCALKLELWNHMHLHNFKGGFGGQMTMDLEAIGGDFGHFGHFSRHFPR